MKQEENLIPLKTQLFDLHATFGARFIEFAGYLVPLAYGNGTIKEAILARQSSSIFDVSHMGQINIFGDKAFLEVDKLVPSNILKLDIFQSCYSMLLNENGGIIDDLIITKKNDCVSLVVNASQKDKIYKMLNSELSTECSVEILDENSLISIQGPKSPEVLKNFFKDINQLKFMNGYEASYNKSNIYISRSGYTGEDGFEISLPNTEVESFVDTVLEDSRINLAGFGARDVLRIEAGLCLYGQDINNSTSPLDANLGWVIDSQKLQNSSFKGSEALKSQIDNDSGMLRIGITLTSKVIPRNGSAVYNFKDKKIGFVSSGCFSPNISKSICMSFISKSELITQKDVLVEVRGKKFEGEIVKIPFIKHKYKK